MKLQLKVVMEKRYKTKYEKCVPRSEFTIELVTQRYTFSAGYIFFHLKKKIVSVSIETESN